jgi:hypothetical protein
MIIGNDIFEAKLIEKTVLPSNCLAHHHHSPSPTTSTTQNHAIPSRPKLFFNSLSHKQPFSKS